jgi:hypothetical protein
VLPGLRFLVSFGSRFSLYAVAGGGFGSFDIPQVQQQPFPQASSTATYRGIFDFGGGVDFRINRAFSIRGEFRDLVTGAGLPGATGRNHPVASPGVAIHF